MRGVHRLIEELADRRAHAPAVRDALADRQFTSRGAIAERRLVGAWRGNLVRQLVTQRDAGDVAA